MIDNLLVIDDVLDEISHLTLSVISETSFGVEMPMSDPKCQTYETAFREYTHLFTSRVINPFLYNDTLYYNFTPSGRRAKRDIAVMHQFTNDVIRTRKLEINQNTANPDKPKSLLDILMPLGMTDDEIRAELDTFAFAGHDT